jgi:hypothetical protein
MFLNRIRMHRPSLVAVAVAAFAVPLAATAAAQSFDPGETSGPRTFVATPMPDAGTRIVAVLAGPRDIAMYLPEGFAVCTASRVGCTVMFTPGTYTARALDLVSLEGILAVVEPDLQLTGLVAAQGPPRPLRYVSLRSEPGGRWPAVVMFTF